MTERRFKIVFFGVPACAVALLFGYTGCHAATPTLTPEDREPVHLAYEKVLLIQGNMLQLQNQLGQAQAAYQAAVEKAKAKCGSDVDTDPQTGILHCAPKPEVKAKPTPAAKK